MNAKTAPSAAAEESTTAAVWEVLDTIGTEKKIYDEPIVQDVESMMWDPALEARTTDQVHPGTCWWWQLWWSRPCWWRSPGWCWHSRCQAPETSAWDAPHTPWTAGHPRTWRRAPECSWGPTRWCRLKLGCWGRGGERLNKNIKCIKRACYMWRDWKDYRLFTNKLICQTLNKQQDKNLTHSLAHTLHQEADFSVGQTGSRHFHNVIVWLGFQRVLGLCGEKVIASGFRCKVIFSLHWNDDAERLVDENNVPDHSKTAFRKKRIKNKILLCQILLSLSLA